MNRARIKHRANAQMREVYGHQWRHVKKFIKKFLAEKNVGDKTLFRQKKLTSLLEKKTTTPYRLRRVCLK